MNHDIICPLCNSNQLLFNFEERDCELYSCQNCDLHFVHPYIQKENQRNPLSSEKQFLSEKQSVKFYLPYIKDYISNNQSLLDIGCGCGELLIQCKKFNVKKITGLENDLERAEFAEKNSGCLIIKNDFSEFNTNEKYDVITLINVISHIPNLNDFFIKTSNILENKGKLIIKTGLLLKGFKKKNGFDWQIPEHIHFFGINTPEYIESKYNLKLVDKIMIPLASELISKEYLLSPGRSYIVNFFKSALLKIPFGPSLVRSLYTNYTKNKLFNCILIFEK